MTRKTNVRSLLRLVLAVYLVGVLGTGPGLARDGPVRVVVSVPPQKTFVERVGGEHVDVHTLVRPGYDPHTYEPTPHQIAALSAAALYIRIGVPFEQAWMARIRSANRAMQVLDARPGIGPHPPSAHDHGEEQVGPAAGGIHPDEHHHTGESDPHIWTDPLLVKRMAGRIRDKLIELAPGDAPDFRRNYQGFAAKLDALDRDIRSLLEPLPNRKFMVFHPAWGHFAAAYGLTQIPIERAGKEPGPRALVALTEQASREQVKVIFVQPQFSARSAAQVARAIGGRVLAIDPLATDYADNLRRVARQIAGALSE